MIENTPASADTPRKNFWRILPGVLISLVALGVLFTLIDWPTFVVALQKADYRYLLLGLPIYLISYLVRSRAWHLLLMEEPSYKLVFFTQQAGYLMNNVLPFRLGELGRAAQEIGQFTEAMRLTTGYTFDLPYAFDVEEESSYSQPYWASLIIEGAKLFGNPDNLTFDYSPTYSDWNKRWSEKYFTEHDHRGWPWPATYTSLSKWTRIVGKRIPSAYYLPGWFADWEKTPPRIPHPWRDHQPGWYMQQLSCRLPGIGSGECTSEFICQEQINPAIPQFIKKDEPPIETPDTVRITVGATVNGVLYGPEQVDLKEQQ